MGIVPAVQAPSQSYTAVVKLLQSHFSSSRAAPIVSLLKAARWKQVNPDKPGRDFEIIHSPSTDSFSRTFNIKQLANRDQQHISSYRYKPSAGFKRYVVGIGVAQSPLKKDCRKLENADIPSIIHGLTVAYDNFAVQYTLCNS